MVSESSVGFKVIVLDSGIEMKEISNVRIVRIKSDKYNLLIMKDYWPVIGEIRGSVVIEGEKSLHYDDVIAFYSMAHNVFHLIIRDKDMAEVSDGQVVAASTKKEEKK